MYTCADENPKPVNLHLCLVGNFEIFAVGVVSETELNGIRLKKQRLGSIAQHLDFSVCTSGFGFGSAAVIIDFSLIDHDHRGLHTPAL
jgi:hypothetical protein